MVNGLDVRVKLAWLAESYFLELTFQEIAEQVINHLIFFKRKKKDFGLYSMKVVTKIGMLLAWKRNSLP